MRRGIWFSLGAIAGTIGAPGLGAVLVISLYEKWLARQG